jgi:CBS domain containing-hemolysin-like protein
MQEAVQARTPAHVWIVGVLATLWNAFGAFDYVMTQTNNEAYLSQFTAEERAFFDSFPAWMEAFWALGVWGALIGSLLLLVRSRYAVHAFGISLVGIVVGMGYQYIGMKAPESLTTGAMAFMPWVILVIGIALFVYARNQAAKGVLR